MKGQFFLLLIAVSLNVTAQKILKCSDGELSFFSEAPLENIEAVNKNATSLINTASKDIVVVVPVRSFRFKRALMEEHFNEKYLESDKYPDATFKGKINENIDFSKDGEYKVTGSGTMNIHGVEKPVNHSGTLIIKAGTVTLKSEFNVAIKDYNITVPKIMMEKIAEVVSVKLTANYLPFK